DLVRLGRRGPDAELVVVEAVEQVDGAQVGGGEVRGRHACARYSWISETAIEPSPTALATRLIERARTSPATNTPGTVVSSRWGPRWASRPPPWAAAGGGRRPRPAGATPPASQSVRGAAPMKTKHASTGSTDSLPSASRMRSALRCPSSPSAPAATAPVR